MKFTAWQNWCDQARKEKFFGKKSALVDNVESLRTERLLKRCFDAIKFYNTQTKFESTRMMLESKIPERENLEYQKECLLKNQDTKAKIAAFRFMYGMGADSKRDALQRWRKYVQYYHHIKDRMKKRIAAIHKLSL